MSKSLRLSEKWFRRGLWLVAIVFASFLIGLGGTVVSDLPQVEQHKTIEDFINKEKAEPLRVAIDQSEEVERAAQRDLDQIEIRLTAAQQANSNARETFSNWIATRQATQQADQDQELIKRTQALDTFSAAVDKVQKEFSAQQKIVLDARQQQNKLQEQLSLLEKDARALLEDEERRVQLRVFGYRLALTLPLLVVAGWLFAKKRKGTYWPFIWGFIFFALFAFFVELVPYLPSYGGYVRYAVGIVVTVLIGRYAINALNRYLAKQQIAEEQPETIRRKELSYDLALVRFSKGVCPGCERAVDLKNTTVDFCPHCGISLFDHCGKCNARKNAFAKFCHCCGTNAEDSKGSISSLEKEN